MCYMADVTIIGGRMGSPVPPPELTLTNLKVCEVLT